MTKAFVVTNTEDHAEIVFADTHNKAKAHVDLDEEYVDLRCRRFPEMDGREKNPPTLRELVEDFEWFGFCDWCGTAVYHDHTGHFWEGTETIFCSVECEMHRKASRCP